MFTSRAEANAFYGKILLEAEGKGPEQLRLVSADLGRKDLFFLLTRLLRRPDIDKDWLFDRCQEVQADPNGYLDLWAREHYKSTIITFGLTIQDILNDPEITIGIFSCTRPIAKAFLTQIKTELEENALLKQLYPDVLYENPERESSRWSLDNGIVVKREGNPKEATVEAWGLVDGQPTSKHFRGLVYDDVVTLEFVTTPDMITKVTDRWAVSLNLGAHGGWRRTIGTRYHFNDSYKTMLDRGAVIERKYPATDNGKPDGKPVFLTHEQNAKKRQEMGPYVYACQMLQDPKADEAQGFLKAWLRPWMPKPEFWRLMNLYIVVDPAGEKKLKNTGTDYTVIWVIGVAPDGRYYLIDGLRDRLNLTQRAAKLFSFVRKYRPIRVGYEKYGLQADIEHIRFMQDHQNYHFEILELGGQMPKNDRIRRLIPLFEQGRFYTPGVLTYKDAEGSIRDLMREFEQDEYEAFPVCIHDDMLDCMARILDEDMGIVFPDADPETELKGGYPNLPEQGNGMDYDPLGAM